MSGPYWGIKRMTNGPKHKTGMIPTLTTKHGTRIHLKNRVGTIPFLIDSKPNMCVPDYIINMRQPKGKARCSNYFSHDIKNHRQVSLDPIFRLCCPREINL
jgi:hypothetical protein